MMDGSYLALSLRDAPDAPAWEQHPGDALYLRTVRGDRESDRVFRLETLAPEGATVPFRVEATAGRLRLRAVPSGKAPRRVNARL